MFLGVSASSTWLEGRELGLNDWQKTLQCSYVEQTEKVVPLFTADIALCEDEGKLVLGVNIDSVKQPIKPDSVGSGYVSHCRTSAFNNHFDYSFVVLQKFKAKRRNE